TILAGGGVECAVELPPSERRKLAFESVERLSRTLRPAVGHDAHHRDVVQGRFHHLSTQDANSFLQISGRIRPAILFDNLCLPGTWTTQKRVPSGSSNTMKSLFGLYLHG